MTTNRLAAIRLLLLDVDGVLTDGRIFYTDSGEEFKSFHVLDGMGLRLFQEAGYAAGVITARESSALTHRCANLNIDLVFTGARDKAALLPEIASRTGIPTAHTAFVGDDLADLTILTQVGLAVAVANARPEIKRVAHMITRASGGAGAVREVCEAILKSKGEWHPLLERLYGPMDR